MNLLSFGGATRRRTSTFAAAAAVAGAGIGVSGIAGATHAAADTSTYSTFDTGVGSWRAQTGSVARRVTTPTQSGPGALEISNGTRTTRQVGAASGMQATDCIQAIPGNRYVAEAWIRTAGDGRSASVALTFLNASSASIARVAGQWARAGSSWIRPLATVAIAPAGARCVVVGVTFGATPALGKNYLDSVTITAKRGGAKNVVGPLRTSGTKILDGNGQPVIFRGMNRPGLEGLENGPPTEADISNAKTWGANFIRVPLGQQLWLTDNCNYDPSFRSKVDDAVKLITGKGMVAMLDLHWHTVGTCGRVGQWPMAEAAPSVTFWKQVAARYKANPLVAFDLYNEPHHLTDDQWRNGGSMTWKGLTYRTAGMQAMYDAVRSTGAPNLVMVTGKNWGNIWPNQTPPITGTNIVYAIHAYTCPEIPAPDCANAAPYDPSQFFKYWTTAETKYPLMVTEFGWPNPDDGLYIRNVINYAEAHGWSWSVYSWGKTWGPLALIANDQPGSTFQPRRSGMPVLRAFPGA